VSWQHDTRLACVNAARDDTCRHHHPRWPAVSGVVPAAARSARGAALCAAPGGRPRV